MESLLSKSMGMDKVIEKYIVKKDYILKDIDILNIIDEMSNIVDMNVELGYVEDLKNDVHNLVDRENLDRNTIIRYANISDFEIREMTSKIIEHLDEQGLLVVIEPNRNLFIDIDYEKLINKIVKCSNLSNCMSVITTLISIQERAIVDERGYLKRDKLKQMYEEAIISANFEKNPNSFNYMLRILSYLDKLYFAYK